MIIYFIAHGETVWNKQRILQGHQDSPLTGEGKQASEKQGKALKEEHIEVIYLSDLGRCVQATEIINRWLQKPTIKTSELRERDLGDLVGQPSEKLDLIVDPDEGAPNGESRNQFKKRIATFLSSLTKEKFKSVLLVTHLGTVRAILSVYYQTDYISEKCKGSRDKIYSLELTNDGIKQGSLRSKPIL